MLAGDNYYSLSVATNGATSTAYFWVTLVSAGSYDGAAVSISPTGTQATYFNYRDNSVQWQAAAARIVTAGATVVTSASSVAGEVGVSPAQNVATTLTLYGTAGPIGSVTVQPGQTSAAFSFPVEASQALQADAAAALLQKAAAKPEAEA